MAAVATRLKGYSTVLGYEIMNEPLPGLHLNLFEFAAKHLYPFYARVIQVCPQLACDVFDSSVVDAKADVRPSQVFATGFPLVHLRLRRARIARTRIWACKINSTSSSWNRALCETSWISQFRFPSPCPRIRTRSLHRTCTPTCSPSIHRSISISPTLRHTISRMSPRCRKQRR